MVPRNTRTLIIKSGFPAGTSHAGVAGIIADSLAGLVDSIQVCPGGVIRISLVMSAVRSFLQPLFLWLWFICSLLRAVMIK